MSPAVVPRSGRSSASLRIEEELKGGERQGIGSILEFSTQKSERKESLRRTFSADMSSKKWLAENLHLQLKKNASTEELSTSSASQGEKEEIHEKKELERPGPFDIWTSILSQKNTKSDESPPITPYIHPLVKRSKSSLSQKSLEICTESLGSETGSDGYSSSSDYFTSDSSDNEEEDEEEDIAVKDEMQDTKKELLAVNYNCSISWRSPPRSFPPPLPSLSRSAWSSLQMRPLRKDGRLIVEAVPVISHSYLHAEREGGRLRLSFINSPCEKEAHPLPQPEEPKAEFMEEEEEQEEEEDEEEEVQVQKGEIVTAEKRVCEKEEERIKVGRPMIVNKIMVAMQHAMHLKNPNPWVGQKMDGQDHEQRRVSSPMLATASFNGYDLYWKRRPMAHPSGKQGPPKKLMVSRKPLEDLLSVKRCNEYRRPVVVWEPFCIATT